MLVAIAGVPRAPAPLASMVILLTSARTVQLTSGGSVEVVVKMISAGNWHWMVEMILSIFSTELYVPPEASTQSTLAPPYCSRMPVPLAEVVRAGILRWWMLLIINSLETSKFASLPSMMELETPVVLVTGFGPIYILFETVTLLALLPEK